MAYYHPHMGTTLRDILEFAVGIERNGAKVYAFFSSQTEDERLKKVWEFLRMEEEAHAERFQRMLQELPGQEDLSNDEYLAAVASGRVFTDSIIAKSTLHGVESDLQALDFALHIEKESIFTYIAFKEALPALQAAALDAVVDEEKRHLVQLSRIRAELSMVRRP